MDWNVFYSTISQTSGAIVGIFAAFLITKIVANQTEFARNKEKSSDFLHKSRALAHEAETRYFQWYNERVADRELNKIVDLYRETKEISTAEEYYDKLNFSPFQSKADALDLIQTKIHELNEEKRMKEKMARIADNSPMPFIENILNQKCLDVHNFSNMTGQITEEREAIDNLLVRVTMQASMNKELLSLLKSSSESSSLINVSICAVMLLFFAGVVYPLSFLPLVPGKDIVLSVRAFCDTLFSTKGALLAVMSLIFSGLMIIFFMVNLKLKHDKKNISELDKYSYIKNYSEYFGHFEEAKETLNNSTQTN